MNGTSGNSSGYSSGDSYQSRLNSRPLGPVSHSQYLHPVHSSDLLIDHEWTPSGYEQEARKVNPRTTALAITSPRYIQDQQEWDFDALWEGSISRSDYGYNKVNHSDYMSARHTPPTVHVMRTQDASVVSYLELETSQLTRQPTLPPRPEPSQLQPAANAINGTASKTVALSDIANYGYLKPSHVQRNNNRRCVILLIVTLTLTLAACLALAAYLIYDLRFKSAAPVVSPLTSATTASSSTSSTPASTADTTSLATTSTAVPADHQVYEFLLWQSGVMTFHLTQTAPFLLRFFHDSELLLAHDVTANDFLTLNDTAKELAINVSRIPLTVGRSADGMQVNATVQDVTCSDAGSYVLEVSSNDTKVNVSANVTVFKMPERPTVDLPTEVFEHRTVTNPVCRTTDLGYNPATDFTWTLQRPGDRLATAFPFDKYSDSVIRNACTKQGSSTLQADRYVGWNGSQLCCQLVNRSSVVAETCITLRVVSAVQLTSRPEAVESGGNVSFSCLAHGVGADAQVDLYHKDQKIASYNASSSTLDSRVGNGSLTVTFNLTKVTCPDAGTYTCVVTDSGIVTNGSTQLGISRPPGNVTMTIPYSGYPAEGHSGMYPTGRVTSLGYSPVMKLMWLLVMANGTNITTPVSDVLVSQNSVTCDSGLNQPQVTLDANRYWGWNNSQLCLQLRHPATDIVVQQDCKRIQLIPNDYCNGAGIPYKLHPYNSCALWVQCSNGIIYPNGPCPAGTCISLAKDPPNCV